MNTQGLGSLAYLSVPARSILHRRKDAQAALSIGNSKFYQLVKEGRLKIVKIGAASYVPDESLRSFVSSLMSGNEND